MLDQIKKAFTELDAEMYERQLTWAKSRKAEISKIMDDARQTRKKLDWYKLFEVAGGKTWFELLAWTNLIEPIVRKNVDRLIESRNKRIITALNKKGITEIQDFELKAYGDGYEGTFVIDGHVVTIRTFLAGGYNIQCLHQRTQIKVK